MRRSSVLATLALTGSLLVLPASAFAAPADVTSLTGSVGDHFALLTWTGGGSAGAVVRDVTGVADPLTPTSGTAVASGGTSAKDPRYTNAAPRTYAVWGKDTDGSTSPTAAVVTVDPVGPLPTTLTLTASRAVAAYGQTYSITGQLKRAGSPSPGRAVQLLARVGGTSTWFTARSLTTDSTGTVRSTLVSTRNIDLYLRYAGDLFSSASASPHRIVQMKPSLGLTLTPNVIVRPESTLMTGTLPPGLPNAAVRLQRRLSDGTYWTFATVKPDSRGRYAYRYTPGSAGAYVYRAALPAQASYLGATSALRVLRIETRNLASGMRGDDVLRLQRQLAALHYLPGAFDGKFGYDLQHAVMTFQKVERLPVTGKWTRTERTRAGAPRGIKLRKPVAGRSIEVSVTRQVLVIADSGRIRTIIDVSTGNEAYYYVNGSRRKAHTPRGYFAVTRKINGMRVSDLGQLYKPSYFVGGYAVHGSPSVPAYPASHGCVRITNPNADRVFSLLTVGAPVLVYDE